MTRSDALKGRLALRRWSTWRQIAQVTFLAWALITSLRHFILADGGSIEASCPFGAVETAWSSLVGGTFLRHLGPSNFIALAVVLLSALALGRIFCGWVCPLGTLQDALAGLTRRLVGREGGLPLHLSRKVDRPLRYLKYLVLGWVLWASVSATVPPLAPFCPFRTLFEFHLSSPLSLGVALTFLGLSLLVERFWCRYLCPLGALLALFNRLSPLRPRVNAERCVACGRCERACPAGINPVKDGTEHPECVRCYSCVEACRRPGAVKLGVPAQGLKPRTR